MNSINIMKAIVLASALALPAFFAGNAFATDCGACIPGAGPIPGGPIITPMDHTAINAAMMTCTTCHTQALQTGTAPAPVPVPATGGITVHPTTKSCDACAIGTAPGSVSAHKNVNSTMTVCIACHSNNSTGGSTVGSTGGSGSRNTMSGHSDDDHQASTRGNSSRHSDKNSKKNHRGNDDKNSHRGNDD